MQRLNLYFSLKSKNGLQLQPSPSLMFSAVPHKRPFRYIPFPKTRPLPKAALFAKR